MPDPKKKIVKTTIGALQGGMGRTEALRGTQHYPSDTPVEIHMPDIPYDTPRSAPSKWVPSPRKPRRQVPTTSSSGGK